MTLTMRIRRIARHAQDRGASAVEYGLLVAAIAAAIVGLVFALGNIVKDSFQHTSDCIAQGQGTAPAGAPAVECNG